MNERLILTEGGFKLVDDDTLTHDYLPITELPEYEEKPSPEHWCDWDTWAKTVRQGAIRPSLFVGLGKLQGITI